MYPKTVVLKDAAVSENSSGGTGKGLVFKAINQLRKVTTIDGKDFNNQKSFKFQQIENDTQIVFFDDVKKHFDFKDLFSVTTSGYRVEKKNKEIIEYNEKNNPKTAISTNYDIESNDASSKRRIFELELENYYTDILTPEDDFPDKTPFFSDVWNKDDWNMFYNVLFYCTMTFFHNNSRIKEYVSNTLQAKKLFIALGSDFIEFADTLDKNYWQDRDEQIKIYETEFLSAKQRAFHTPTKFTRNLKKYCELKKLFFGTRYSTGNTAQFKISEEKIEQNSLGFEPDSLGFEPNYIGFEPDYIYVDITKWYLLYVIIYQNYRNGIYYM